MKHDLWHDPLFLAMLKNGGKGGSASGDIVTFRGNGEPVRGLRISIDPVQDLHGYDYPWPAGGGKNLAKILDQEINAFSIDFTSVALSGELAANGTASGSGTSPKSTPILATTLPAGSYKAIVTNSFPSSYSYIRLTQVGASTVFAQIYDSTTPVEFTLSEETDVIGIFRVQSGEVFNNFKTKILICKAEITDYSWTPYSNICPISGWSAVNLFRESAYDPTATPYIPITIPTPPGTVYGGYISIGADGSAGLVVNRANIASYSGETLPGEWISSMDMYSTGGTPTIGAQVVYELATPLTYPLSDITVQTLVGTNVMWADTGPVDVEWAGDKGFGKEAMLAAILHGRNQ